MAVRAVLLLLLAVAAAALTSCQPEEFSEQERAAIASLSLASLPPLPADPSNAYSDDRLAAALGATFFFEQRFSANGAVSCATCHRLDRQFQDDLPRGVGIAQTDRRTMPLAGVARSPFQFWDGRRDSLWSQALAPLEDKREHGGTRAAYLHVVADHFRARYERIFGPLPDMALVPAKASPLGDDEEQAAWAALAPAVQDDINRAFSNIGKALAAFERSIVHKETRFDRFAAAVANGEMPAEDAALTAQERQGLRLFIGKAECGNCHNGPRFTDDHFHNTGVAPVAGLPNDLGREQAVPQVLADPFNCLGAYSDASPEGCAELRYMVKEGPELRRAFKTPSLRGVAERPPYMHSGQIGTLEEVLQHYVTAPRSVDGTSEVVALKISEREAAALVAFLKTLSE